MNYKAERAIMIGVLVVIALMAAYIFAPALGELWDSMAWERR